MSGIGSQPGIATDFTLTDVDIYFATPQAPLIVGVTLKSGVGAFAIGTLLGEYTADNKFGKFDASGSGGLETARGILLTQADTTDADQQAAMLVGGALVRVARLTGADVGGTYVVDLNGRLVLNDTVLVI